MCAIFRENTPIIGSLIYSVDPILFFIFPESSDVLLILIDRRKKYYPKCSFDIPSSVPFL